MAESSGVRLKSIKPDLQNKANENREFLSTGPDHRTPPVTRTPPVAREDGKSASILSASGSSAPAESSQRRNRPPHGGGLPWFWVVLILGVLYHPEEEMYRYWGETNSRLQKREVLTAVTIASLLGLGAAGTATAVTSPVTQRRGLSRLQAAIDEDLQKKKKSRNPSPFWSDPSPRFQRLFCRIDGDQTSWLCNKEAFVPPWKRDAAFLLTTPEWLETRWPNGEIGSKKKRRGSPTRVV
ncbi:uncharacterized protein LOC129735060 [Falco cherrug]|uniref:uncharacterized protein LOC129735060 n=1 Tax=Falco cherrug TaxID=345164 RepID=UPI00247A1B95|nr:uncharacterized protein LOC129735060 [Falco cherrug]